MATERTLEEQLEAQEAAFQTATQNINQLAQETEAAEASKKQRIDLEKQINVQQYYNCTSTVDALVALINRTEPPADAKAKIILQLHSPADLAKFNKDGNMVETGEKGVEIEIDLIALMQEPDNPTQTAMREFGKAVAAATKALVKQRYNHNTERLKDMQNYPPAKWRKRKAHLFKKIS